jgi:hypothetical protein
MFVLLSMPKTNRKNLFEKSPMAFLYQNFLTKAQDERQQTVGAGWRLNRQYLRVLLRRRVYAIPEIKLTVLL